MHILLDEEKNLAIKLKGLKKQNFKELSVSKLRWTGLFITGKSKNFFAGP